jgi:DNA-binding LacI/PurR family transcriptional regulator
LYSDYILTKGLRRRFIERIPLYRQVREYFLDGIRNGRWKEGGSLPSENQLAETLQVSRITIKHALEELIREGLVYRIQGKGTFLSAGSMGEPVVFAVDPVARNKALVFSHLPLVAFLTPSLHGYYMTTLLNNIEGALAERNYQLIFSLTHGNQDTEKNRLQGLKKTGVKGIIIYPVNGEIYNKEILRLTVDSYPLVVIDRYLRGVETNYVCSDNVSGAFQGTEHLLSLGHRNIAIVSYQFQGTSSIEDRLVGYERAFASFKVDIRPEHRLVSLKNDDEKNKGLIRKFLKNNPEITGVIAVSAALGAQIIEVAAELGRGIPDELSIVFFDKIEHLPFKPTYIQQRGVDIAREAVRLLFETIEDPGKKCVKVDMPAALVVGESTAAPPCRHKRSRYTDSSIRNMS